MKVLFKGGPQSYECSEPIEQRVFKSGVPIGWAIMFHITADLSSSEVDSVITPDGLSELRFIGDGDKTTLITGYNTVSACTIRHKNSSTVVELQFTKINSSENPTVPKE